ncbi:MAG TPA: branched-chain amino acid transaminase [Polyangiaceae bacterium]|nr:branched-chain amino acid transaminase [Polyangiaceae bacterium]
MGRFYLYPAAGFQTLRFPIMSVDAFVEWPSFMQIPEEDSVVVPRPKGQALSPYIWWNGEIKNAHDQSIHYYANALHYGTAVFEGIRCYPTANGAALFRLKDHMERLVGSARIYGMKLGFSVEELCRGALDVTRQNGVSNAYLRPLAFFGYGPIDITPKKECAVNVFIATRELGYFLGEKALRNGARLMVSSWRKFPHACLPTMAKASGHYANSVLAAHEAYDHGFDDAILLNQDGTVSSTTGGNLFFVRGHTLYTNDTTSAIVPGITQDSILTLARDAGVDVSIRAFTREELLRADEVFMTGTAAEVTPVHEIDGIEYRTGKSTLAAQLQGAYLATVTGRNPAHKEWIAPV